MIFDGLRFLQINLHHCRDANDAFIKYAIDFNINIALIQDPYIFDGAIAGLPPNWPFFLSNKLSCAIIFTNPDYIALESFVSDNCVFISLNTRNGIVFIGSYYSPPSGDLDVELTEWSGLFPNFDNIVIGGDFNVPFQTLGYSRDSERTDILLEHIYTNNLCIIKIGCSSFTCPRKPHRKA